MNIHIFDVEHGACNFIRFPSGETMLIDCGHNSYSDWRPSTWLCQNMLAVTNLTITNFDEDHVSDLLNIYKYCKPQSLSKNWKFSSSWIRNAKTEFGMGEGVTTACKMIDEYTGPNIITNWGGVTIERFCHGLAYFQDENSLSLVTFIIDTNVRMVFPGDLTKASWRKFLEDTTFCNLLRRVNIFVASHHGREDGYEPEVFKYCKPDIIIISDKSIIHDTQRINYSQHASGISWNGTEIKKVLTTRNNGAIRIEKTNAGYHVYSAS